MAQISLGATEKSRLVVSKTNRSSRLYFVDRLRVALAILVVLHHIALVYGASLEGYYYVEPPFTDPGAFVTLLAFALVNQAWFMGAFFLLAGYFTPGSFDRKGVGSFLRDKLLRLGIPIAVFYFLLSPISFLGYYLMPAALTGITEPLTWERFWLAYPNFTGLGPLWFVAMLFIFNLGYAVWRMLSKNRASSSMSEASPPSYLRIVIFILALALASYLWRMIIPLGKAVLQFPTLAYLPQYLSFFVLGIIASRRDWFRTLTGSMAAVGFVVAAVAAVLLFPIAFSGQWFTVELTGALENGMGGGHWQSAVYALWDSAFAVGLCLGLIALFRRFYNGQGSFSRFLSQHSYTVYIIHLPIVVFLAYALREIELGSLLKFGLASVVMVPTCFVVAYIVRKIPYASKIL